MSRSHQLLCMPMLGVTLAWKQRLAEEPAAAPLLLMLDHCVARLLQHYSLVLRDRVDAIARCAHMLAVLVKQRYLRRIMSAIPLSTSVPAGTPAAA